MNCVRHTYQTSRASTNQSVLNTSSGPTQSNNLTPPHTHSSQSELLTLGNTSSNKISRATIQQKANYPIFNRF